MDVKVGTQSYEHDASAEKIAYEKQKFPLQETVGFRIQGIKVLDPTQQQYVEFDKHFGRQVQSPEALVPAFQQYFRAFERDARTLAVLLQSVRNACTDCCCLDVEQSLDSSSGVTDATAVCHARCILWNSTWATI